jgi:hypothetical protein
MEEIQNHKEINETNIQQLPKDVLLLMALDFDANTITNLCSTSHKFNNIICKNTDFWKRKFLKEYPNLDISNVKQYTKLYSYLKSRALHESLQKHTRKAKPGDIFIGETGTNILGKDNIYHTIVINGQFDIAGLKKSNIRFPEFSPEYFQNIGINYFLFPSKTLKKLIEGRSQHHFVEGPFGERYYLIIEKNFRNDQEWFSILNATDEILASFSNDGQIYISE